MMALLLALVESPATTACLTYHSVVITGQPKNHGHHQSLLAILTTYQLPLSSTTGSDSNQPFQGRPGDATMVPTGPLLPMRLNQKCSNF